MSPKPGIVEACPNCESTEYNARKTKSPTYRCVCGETFDDPVRRWNKQRAPHERGDGSVLPTDAVRDAIRERGLSYVTTRKIGDAVSHDQRVIGQTLAELADRGELSRWGNSNKPLTWSVDDLAAEGK